MFIWDFRAKPLSRTPQISLTINQYSGKALESYSMLRAPNQGPLEVHWARRGQCEFHRKKVGSVQLSEVTAATCSQLAEVVYWAATAHLSERDKQHLLAAEVSARKPNKLRPAISGANIDEARKMGVISHGNAGPGLTTLDGARQDAIATATVVYEMCANGRLSK